MKEIMSCLQGIEKVAQAGNAEVGNVLEVRHPEIPLVRLVNVQGLVWLKSWNDAGGDGGHRNSLMRDKLVGWIVGSADQLDVECFQNPLS